MDENIAGTVHLHHASSDEKTAVIAEHHEVVHRTTTGNIYVTRNGIELVPTPSTDPNDPLNWPFFWKISVLICICCSSLMIAFCAAGIIPGFMAIAEAYHTDINHVSYLVSVNVLWLALGPIIWSPICDTYGRRPVYLLAMFITLVSSIACAVAKSYGIQVFTRMLQGFGASGAFTVGAGSIADVYFLHERGLYTGCWIAIGQSGPFIAPMITGAVIENAGWRWSLWLMAIFAGVFLVMMFFFLPETLYIRHLGTENIENTAGVQPKRKRLFAQMEFRRISPRPISFLEFFRPLYMLRYPSVGLIALSWCFGVALPDIGISNIVPLAFGGVYGWGPRAQGLSNAGFLVGCLLGEAFAGPMSDLYIRYRLKRNGGVFIPEMRLHPVIPGLILMPLGLAGFGVCVQHQTHWIGPVSMMAVTIFGYQQTVSLGMAYGIDCYKPQAPYVAAAMIFCRQLFGFTVNYWLLPWVENQGFQNSYIAQGALTLVLGSGPILLLMLFGQRWREAMPVPKGFGTSQ
ncbi:hypothetical protein BAUCODRAFT_480367 [Baudoinia panamericana UAMH 10762]|uniref:Major facilitator superfamily (MFS) profile domain-containing protein n=1 Tax=Baudoinia panamericana (strain UAMH 10762) TaxID=717646 RepID=M2NBN1_BAUPA|nr:uncharacterized protein BAUCODRAFT_480367 [Baudoinia panamericana UAMH 10762]EMC96554.1 hypothetical protein BAUCODRAFT_480367 [Baudoinia panamericana UAMH 10762]